MLEWRLLIEPASFPDILDIVFQVNGCSASGAPDLSFSCLPNGTWPWDILAMSVPHRQAYDERHALLNNRCHCIVHGPFCGYFVALIK